MSTDKRSLLKATAATLSLAPVLIKDALAQPFDPAEAEKILFPAPGLPGGGQMEVRMVAHAENHDPDVVEIAQRLRPYNLQSWYDEHARMADKNQALAAKFEQEGSKVTASEFFLRAAGFWREAVVYLTEADPRMLPAYNNLKTTFDKAWTLVPPPFERVQIPYEGKALEGHFYAARARPGEKAPVVFNYAGADGILLRGSGGGAGQYRARGISFLDVDGPGQGGALRLNKIYAPPDSERYVKAVADYLVTRPDVDVGRMAIHGSSMGGYTAPRGVTADKRFKACAVWSGAFSLREDIFDFYPPIQERLRWLSGAKDLADARKKMAEFTLEGMAQKIECPLLVGYNIDDRIMDPRGALRLFKEAVNAKPSRMIEGVGHGKRKFELRTYIADWFAKQLGTA
jgi:dienelactone hydrolase